MKSAACWKWQRENAALFEGMKRSLERGEGGEVDGKQLQEGSTSDLMSGAEFGDQGEEDTEPNSQPQSAQSGATPICARAGN